MVEHSLGITIMPKLVLGAMPHNVRAVPFEQETFRIIGLSTSYNISPATEKFIEILQNWLHKNEENFYVM